MQLNESDAYAITHTHIQINIYIHIPARTQLQHGQVHEE